jgi:hypothetical protein
MRGLIRRSVPVAALALVAALVGSPSAAAETDGPCQATIAGESPAGRDTGPRGEPIDVDEDERVRVTMTSLRPITRLKVDLEWAGLRLPVHDDPTEGTEWERVVELEDYSIYGVGLYKIVGTSEGQGFSCTASALVDVDGVPWRLPAGIAGLVATVIGTIGILALLVRRRASGVAPFAGAFFGLLLGAGVGLLLQQLSVVYPTAIVAGLLLGGGLVLGILSGMFGRRAGPSY